MVIDRLLERAPPASLDVVIGAMSAPQRLDQALTAALVAQGHALSRRRVAALITDGLVAREPPGGTLVEPSLRVKPGERFRVLLPAPRPARPEAQAIPLAILHEDDDLLVVDKPAGLVVHPAAGNPDRTLVNALLAHCGPSLSGIGGIARPGIVHRLDKDTSGLLVVAKTDLAHDGLSRQFAAHGRDGRLHRLYQAFVAGRPEPPAGRIDAAIGRSTANRKAFAVVTQGGKLAVTHYRVIRSYGRPVRASLLACRLETGRTHQIRVHLAARGHPVLGDPVYAGRRGRATGLPAPARQALHAAELGFVHPRSGARLRFQSPLPADLLSLAETLEQL